MASEKKYYTRSQVWTIEGTTPICYQVLQDVATKQFAIQSKDYGKATAPTESLNRMERQFLALFTEVPIGERTGFFSSIEEAIQDFEGDFGKLR